MYPEIEPYERGLLEAGDGNAIYWECCGSPKGMPAVYLHGGPGSGSSPGARRYFDPEKYRIVLYDQRGCGRNIWYATWNYCRTRRQQHRARYYGCFGSIQYNHALCRRSRLTPSLVRTIVGSPATHGAGSIGRRRRRANRRRRRCAPCRSSGTMPVLRCHRPAPARDRTSPDW